MLTTFDRPGSPLIRYRTGDLVRVDPQPCPCGRALVRLDGGIRGRVDDMIVLRGNNLHPGALQTILHRLRMWRSIASRSIAPAALPVLRIEVEPLPGVAGDALAERVEHAIRTELLFRAEVRAVPPGSLPRYEMKARRLIQKTAHGTESDSRNC